MPLNQNKFKYIGIKNIDALPQATGVYCFKGEADFLYIGKAINIKERVKNHIQQPVFKDSIFAPQTEKIGFIATGSEIEALILEANLIKKYQPRYNQQWKDGKNYYFIAITKEQWPRAFITHQTGLIESGIKKKELRKRKKPNSLFIVPNPESIGPFIDGNSLKQTLRILRRIFPFRTCHKMPKKACLYKDLKLCPAPCEERAQELKIRNQELRVKNYEKNREQKMAIHNLANRPNCAVMEKSKKENDYRKNIKNLMAILSGKKNSVIKNLQKEMQQASKQQNFEKAKTLRDQIFALENVFSHSQIFKQEQSGKPQSSMLLNWKKTEKKLQKILCAKKTIAQNRPNQKIKRIEGYDISNIQGQEATGGLVVFENGKPNKDEYRKFKIKITDKPNDTAMIKEVISRRLKHKEWQMPQVMLIDGGKGQLNAAIEIARGGSSPANLKIVALAKRNNELFIEGKERPVLLKNLPQEISNLILQIRDESHRFAIAYHKKLRSRIFIQ